MMPGLHPGLLLARAAQSGGSDYLYIDTSGGSGPRSLGLSVSMAGAVAPYQFSWVVSIAFPTSPSSGSGTTSSTSVGFSTTTYYDGPEIGFQLVGSASLTVTPAAGPSVTRTVDVYAGGNQGEGGGPKGGGAP